MMTLIAVVYYGLVGIVTLIVGLTSGHWEPLIATGGAGAIWFGVLAFGSWVGGTWV